MLIQSISNFSLKNHLFENNQKIIVGLSGGPDSIFLLYVLKQLSTTYKFTLIAAHLDHEWRKDSGKDVEFCATLCKMLGIDFIAKKASELPITLKKEGSQEALGRNLRRFFLEQVLKDFSADVIALGHHAQDQQETFFLRLIRGTSLSGLTSMAPKAGLYIRPLLETNKSDILNYLHTNTIEYLIDPTNESTTYLRNRIRLTVLPPLHAADDRFNNNFSRTIHSLQATEHYLDILTQETFETISSLKNNIYYICSEQFLNLHPVMLYRILMCWLIKQKVALNPTQALFEEIIRFARQTNSTSHEIGSWRLIKSENRLFFEKL